MNILTVIININLFNINVGVGNDFFFHHNYETADGVTMMYKHQRVKILSFVRHSENVQ